MNYNDAKQKFETYLESYDRSNDKVRLKIIHTYGVVHDMSEICHRMHLTEEDTELARIIALLHDIGRFEQLKRFDSFEPTTMDHAAYGVQVLFEEGMIRQLFRKTPGMILFAPQLPDTVISTSKELPIIGRCSMHV